MEIEDYIENYDFVQAIKQYIDKSPKTINVFRKHDYMSMTGVYKKTELLLCIYCCKLLMILNKDFNNLNHNKKNRYCDLVLSLYLDFFISSWKIACSINISDEDMMKVLKEEREPLLFYKKLMIMESSTPLI